MISRILTVLIATSAVLPSTYASAEERPCNLPSDFAIGRLTTKPVAKDALKVTGGKQIFYFEKLNSISKGDISQATIVSRVSLSEDVIPPGYEIAPDASPNDLLMKFSPAGTEKLRILTSKKPAKNTPKAKQITVDENGKVISAEVIQIGLVAGNRLLLDPVTVQSPLENGEARLSFGVDKGGERLKSLCR